MYSCPSRLERHNW